MNDQTAGKNLKQVLYSIFYWRDNRYGSDDVFTECKFQLLVDRLHFYRKDIEFLEKFYVELDGEETKEASYFDDDDDDWDWNNHEDLWIQTSYISDRFGTFHRVEWLRVLIDNVPPSKEMAEQLNII